MKMTVIDVQADNGECTVTTDQGQFTRWPGREINGHAWWSFIAMGDENARPMPVTVIETVHDLEALHEFARFAEAA